jgi:peptidoglycan/xylan/chitin deacetylase (PgdA/CDA1 family)
MFSQNLNKIIKDWASRTIWHIARKRSDINNCIPILCYHRVLPIVNSCKDFILPDQFKSHLEVLRQEGFRSLSLREYAQIARGEIPLTRRSVLITFDDGYADNYKIAWPISQKYNIKMNFFICTSLIGEESPFIMTKDGYKLIRNYNIVEGHDSNIFSHIRQFPQLWRSLTWKELREMKNAGAGIGFHSHYHRNLALLTPKEIVDDITTGQGIFKRRIGYEPREFALPYGGYEEYTLKTLAILRHLSMELIFTTNLGRVRLPSNQHVFSRIVVYPQDDLATFKRKLLGAYDWLESIQQIKKFIVTHKSKKLLR